MTNDAEPVPLPYGIAAPEHRLPSETRVGRVRLAVADLERSLTYYERVLGLRVLDGGADSAVLGAADGRPLVELHARSGLRPVSPRGRLGLYHYAILLPERPALGAFVRHLTELGERAGASDHLVSEALYLRDPDGLGIEVYADRPREKWRVRDHELAMATDPLDLQGLVAASGGSAWEGMPAGTTMGHIHLHVGDLELAEAFYHRALGLDKVVWSYPGALFLSAGGYHHHLGLNTWAAGAAPAQDDEARLIDWELAVPGTADIGVAVGGLREAGFTVEDGAGGDGPATAVDPWGTRLRFVLSSGRGARDG